MKKLLFFVAVLFFISCEESTRSIKTTTKYADLKVQSNYDGYVILHSIDGQETVEVQSVNAGETAYFYDIDTSHVTFSVAYMDGVYPFIYTYFEVPLGVYDFNQAVEYENITNDAGYAKFNFEFSDSTYNNPAVSDPKKFHQYWDLERNNNIISINKIKSDNKLKTLCLATDKNNNSGYYQWINDENFQIDDTNSYDISFPNPMQRKVINVNVPVFDRWVCSTNKESEWFINHSFNDDQVVSSEISVPFAPNIDESDIYGLGLAIQAQPHQSYRYFQKYEELPDFVDIPELDVSTNFDINTGILSDVSINGNADFILVMWEPYNFEDETPHQLWRSYYPPTKSELKRPNIPQNILDEFGITSINPIWPWLFLYDFDKVEGYDIEFIKKHVSRKPPFYYCENNCKNFIKSCGPYPDEKKQNIIKEKLNLYKFPSTRLEK